MISIYILALHSQGVASPLPVHVGSAEGYGASVFTQLHSRRRQTGSSSGRHPLIPRHGLGYGLNFVVVCVFFLAF